MRLCLLGSNVLVRTTEASERVKPLEKERDVASPIGSQKEARAALAVLREAVETLSVKLQKNGLHKDHNGPGISGLGKRMLDVVAIAKTSLDLIEWCIDHAGPAKGSAN